MRRKLLVNGKKTVRREAPKIADAIKDGCRIPLGRIARRRIGHRAATGFV